MMKEIKAYIKKHKLDEVIHVLKENHVEDISISDVRAVGWHHEDMKMYEDLEKKYPVNRIVKLELICAAGDTERLVKLIREHAYTGTPGDGVIFVSNIEQALKIRSGETGRQALE
jgi:nitrogen regulatory protein P-II 1